MKTCFNITCNKRVLALYPDQNGSPGRVCFSCFDEKVARESKIVTVYSDVEIAKRAMRDSKRQRNKREEGRQ